MTDRLTAALERIADALEVIAERDVRPVRRPSPKPKVQSLDEARRIAREKLRRSGGVDR